MLTRRQIVFGTVASVLLVAALFVGWRFDRDIKIAAARAAQGSLVAQTRCGDIEYQESGTGVPLLVIHGSGGGHDQGMAFAGELARHGIRVIAMSRFGYLRTPMPADASPEAQADAHACLLDALGIRRAAVIGASAGSLSAMQLAIRHPVRVSALVLLVPVAYKPATVDDSVAPLSPLADKALNWLVGSDFVFWVALRIARDQVIRSVLATPPAQVAIASAQEQARVSSMLDGILPLSVRAQGLRHEAIVTKHLTRYALEEIRAPTLIISERDDGYGTFANAQYTASQIAGSQFIGFEQGGHVWVGHNDEVQREIVKWVISYAGAWCKLRLAYS